LPLVSLARTLRKTGTGFLRGLLLDESAGRKVYDGSIKYYCALTDDRRTIAIDRILGFYISCGIGPSFRGSFRAAVLVALRVSA
jgi:hypothetical protein